jgi:ribosome-associated translation inhibitor RaiA
MDTESLHAHIEHQSAELRSQYPHIKDCHSAMVQWDEGGVKRYSLHLDIRWPEHQTIVSGETKDSAAAAIAAAFQLARQRVRQAAGASR